MWPCSKYVTNVVNLYISIFFFFYFVHSWLRQVIFRKELGIRSSTSHLDFMSTHPHHIFVIKHIINVLTSKQVMWQGSNTVMTQMSVPLLVLVVGQVAVAVVLVGPLAVLVAEEAVPVCIAVVAGGGIGCFDSVVVAEGVEGTNAEGPVVEITGCQHYPKVAGHVQPGQLGQPPGTCQSVR